MATPAPIATPRAAHAPTADRGEMSVAELQGMAAAYNPRTISRTEFAALRRSVRYFGFVEPVVVNRRLQRIVGGHQRIRAAAEEGYTELPVVFVDLDEPSEKQLNLALNRISGDWDDEKLRQVLSDIEHAGGDVSLTGFTDEQLAELLTMAPKEGNTDDDAAPLVAKVPITADGDVWELGPHRLICGDSRKPDVIATLMAGHLADLIVTDPPYNVNYESSTTGLKIQNDQMDGDAFLVFLHQAFLALRSAAKAGAAIYVCHAIMESANFHRAMISAGWKLAQCCVWVKQSLVMGRSDYQWQHEPVLYGWNPTGAHRWYSDRKQSTVWEFDKPKRSVEHPTMKPVALIEYILGNSSRGGDVVLDAFGGSGTTLIACEKHHRMARLVELDPLYCDVIVRRWQEFSGGIARHVASGESFAQRELAQANAAAAAPTQVDG